LVGNPINTIASLLATLDVCQRQADILRKHINGIQNELFTKDPAMERRGNTNKDRLWKNFALISISYGEWNVYGVDQFLLNSL
jgi:hypothetical protein